MKKNNLLTSLLIFGTTLSLASCGNKQSAPEVTSLKSGLLNLALSNNYTLTYLSTSSGLPYVPHDIIFTANSIGTVSSYRPEVDSIYYNDSHAVYSIGYNGYNYCGGEYLNCTNVWDGTLAASFYNVELDYLNSIDDSSKTLLIKNKNYRINYLKIMGYQESDYVSLDSLKASYSVDEDNKPIITFEMSYNSKVYTYYAHDFGTSVNEVVNDYIKKGGTTFVPDEHLTKLRNGLKGNNYTQKNYSIGQGYVGYVVFNENYFYSYTGSTLTYASGHIAINAPSKGRYGIYSMALVMNTETQELEYYDIDVPVYDEPDIVTFYNYPSNLALLNHLEFCRPWDTSIITKKEYTPEGANCLVTDSTILYDFSNNFNMSGSFDGQVPLALGIDIDYLTNSFAFIYKFSYSGSTYIMPFVFVNVGTTYNATLEAVLTSYK